MELFHYIFHHRNVVSSQDHTRLLELCRSFDFPDKSNPESNHNYHIHGNRSQVILEPEHGEIFKLVHKAHMRVMPKIYKDFGDTLPENPIYDKYSGYWLCKYPEGGYLSQHADLDADAGSVTTGFNINDDYEGGEVCFWDEHKVEPEANSIHVFPSNHLYQHEVKPVTKGDRYSVITWFSYQKGRQWLI